MWRVELSIASTINFPVKPVGASPADLDTDRGIGEPGPWGVAAGEDPVGAWRDVVATDPPIFPDLVVVDEDIEDTERAGVVR